jgi:hypothetical protein
LLPGWKIQNIISPLRKQVTNEDTTFLRRAHPPFVQLHPLLAGWRPRRGEAMLDLWMEAEMTDEIRPCPYCGAKNTDVGFIQHTDNCYLMQKYMRAPKAKLIEAWNTRPLEAALETERDAAKEAQRWIPYVLHVQPINKMPSHGSGFYPVYGGRLIIAYWDDDIKQFQSGTGRACIDITHFLDVCFPPSPESKP